jgi:energy-coupling factor transporter ATP-binding protein EcfA2
MRHYNLQSWRCSTLFQRGLLRLGRPCVNRHLVQRGTTMAKRHFTAAKARSDRPGWSITFRHPLRTDSQGKPGRKVRRGLNTSDEGEADALVEQMNQLLRDQSWWSAAKRREAEIRFASQIVEAFYGELQAGKQEPEFLRESYIPMPGADDGFSRVLFVGTTGAGKTTLLRQLIGSDPEEDRFPSTAPAKTTIADIEIITAGAEFEAIVTFFSEFQIQAYVEECVLDAALASRSGAPLDKVADRFLSHRDQKFRLTYVLGPWNATSAVESADEFSFDEEDSGGVADDALPPQEQRKNQEVLQGLVTRISQLSKQIEQSVSEELDLDLLEASQEDREALQQLIEEAFEAELYKQEDFHELVQDVLDRIRSRFDLIQLGELRRDPSEWPSAWTFSTTDRSEFIRNIRWFSSNYWPHFGRLLTPIVQGIRVKGPLYPGFKPDGARLVLIDGQGLGHTPDFTSSISTNVTRRFDEVDVILLVDNAQQPMQAAPLSLLRAVAASGNHDKLAVAFTHFDQIKGQNLASAADKRAHVMASVLSALNTLRDILGGQVVKAIEFGLDHRCFMLGGTDRRLSLLPEKAGKYMEGQLTALVEFCESAMQRGDEAEAALTYDPMGMSFAIQDAASKFHAPWNGRLGLASHSATRKEHWTRVKALTKRIGNELSVEYDTLRPLADFHSRLVEAISLYLDQPLEAPSDEQEEQRAKMRIRRIVTVQLLTLTRKRLIEAELTEWRDAYNKESGTGSTYRRAVRIAGLFDRAAPVPGAVMTDSARGFLGEVAAVVTSAIQTVGGQLKGKSLA